MSDITAGTYRIENTGFSQTPTRVLDLKDNNPAADTPIICYPNNDGDNQKWRVTRVDAGYNFQAVAPPSYFYVDSIGPDKPVTGNPLQKTTFRFREAGGSDLYQIIATENKTTYAFEAPESITDTVVLKPLDPTNSRQIWRIVFLN